MNKIPPAAHASEVLEALEEAHEYFADNVDGTEDAGPHQKKINNLASKLQSAIESFHYLLRCNARLAESIANECELHEITMARSREIRSEHGLTWDEVMLLAQNGAKDGAK